MRDGLRKPAPEVRSPSLKSILLGHEENKGKISVKEQFEQYANRMLNEPFTEEMLFVKWNQFLDTLGDRPNLKSSLNRKPLLGVNGRILLKVESTIQEELIRNNKPQVVAWLRSELKNNLIDLTIEVVSESIQKVAYTDSEKLEEMLRKNSNVALLRQRFNLDFDN